MKPVKNKRRRDPRYFLHEADEMGPGQEMRDRIAAHQGVESTPARKGKDIAADLGYDDGPEQGSYPELMEAIREVMDLAFGEDSYDIVQKLQALADFETTERDRRPYPPRQSYDSGGQAKPGTAGLSRTEEEDAWLFGTEEEDDDPGIVLPSPGKGMTHDPMGRPGSRGGTSPLRGKAMRK